jgi:uncharacterized protein involved in response to NO
MLRQFSAIFDVPFWGRGFRPFFLLGAIYAALMVLAWVFFLHGLITVPMLWNNPVLWHAHEMIYGFTVAIIAGFLLTAVANWTGSAPVRRINLAFLCIIWTVGRIAFWLPYASPAVLSFIDLSFLPFLAVTLSIPLIRTGNKHNFMFPGILSLLFLGNLHMHLAAAGLVHGDPRITAYAVVLVVMAIISIVGSRIIPSFTVAGLRMRGQILYQTVQVKTDIVALLLLLTSAISVTVYGLESFVTAIFATGAGLIHLWRMRSWHSLKTDGEPMLWILHAGHLWLVAGLLTLGLYAFALVDQVSLALHMLTVGCIGSMTLGMMSRVALGHTGRQIVASGPVTISFWMMQGAAIVRCLAILMQDENYNLWIEASGILWATAFIIYLTVYTPMLLRRRPDGAEA